MVTIFEQGNHVFILNLRSVGITFNLKKLYFYGKLGSLVYMIDNVFFKQRQKPCLRAQ